MGYSKEIRDSLQRNLHGRGIHDAASRCYIVPNDIPYNPELCGPATVGGAEPPEPATEYEFIDFKELIADLCQVLFKRRYTSDVILIRPDLGSTSGLLRQIGKTLGFGAGTILAVGDAIKMTLSTFRDPKLVLKALAQLIKKHPYRTLFIILSIALILNPVALAGFGSGGVAAGM